jgi:hypothetical protein
MSLQELDENQEYVEAEDEFDINEKPAAPAADADAAEDAEVDVITRERLLVFSSDEEDEGGSEEPLHWLPAVSCLAGRVYFWTML